MADTKAAIDFVLRQEDSTLSGLPSRGRHQDSNATSGHYPIREWALALRETKGCDRLWIARAISSLPVPVSPVIRTVESVGATLDTRESTARRAGEVYVFALP